MTQPTLIKQNEKGSTYQADGFKICYRNKGSISGDNNINPKETIYLITGSAQITLQDKIRAIDAPAIVEFSENTYHAILALTNISFILYEK